MAVTRSFHLAFPSTIFQQILRELEEYETPASEQNDAAVRTTPAAPDPASKNVWLNRKVRFIAAGVAMEGEYGIANSAWRVAQLCLSQQYTQSKIWRGLARAWQSSSRMPCLPRTRCCPPPMGGGGGT